MRAILTTGEEVVLSKDCGCANQEGPHWLHSNESDQRRCLHAMREFNAEMRAIIRANPSGKTDFATWIRYEQLELARSDAIKDRCYLLQRLQMDMLRLGIKRLINEHG